MLVIIQEKKNTIVCAAIHIMVDGHKIKTPILFATKDFDFTD